VAAVAAAVADVGFLTNGTWPANPRLDPFRDAVWELTRDGIVVGHIASEINRMRTLPALWVKREFMVFDVIWADGTRECQMEDYGPDWLTLIELERGIVEVNDGVLDATPLSGPERDRIWAEYVAHNAHH
jgi:hypothetical protein